jgi:hypothetical protein
LLKDVKTAIIIKKCLQECWLLTCIIKYIISHYNFLLSECFTLLKSFVKSKKVKVKKVKKGKSKSNPPLSSGNIWFGNKVALQQRRLSKWSSLLSTGRVPDQAGGEHHGGGRREEHHLPLHGERT